MYRVCVSGEIDCDALLAQARRQYMDEAMEAAMDWDSLEAATQQDQP